MYNTPIWAGLPFFILLAAIAACPVINNKWWAKYYPHVSIGFGLLTVIYYLIFTGVIYPVFHSLVEYFSFIVLIGSLYIITGGIHIRLSGRAKPWNNVVLLALGGLVSNLIGTTGASMILIRPYIRVNKYRIKPYHIVFFIFIVSNIGGALTPIGDPPLFVGYLKGVPFFWPLKNLWLICLLCTSLLLIIFYVFEHHNFLKLSKSKQHEVEEIGEHGEVTGLRNIFFIIVVLIAVFITNPPFLREVIMIIAAIGSYISTHKDIHGKNDFDFEPLKEVAVLFAGIFITMVPVLEWVRQNSASLGLKGAGEYYYASGVLSAVLDSTPTYLNFLNAAIGQFINPGALQLFTAQNFTALGNVPADQIPVVYLLTYKAEIIRAISTGAVFFGAATYIGNGPNMMVKSIAEQSGVECPSFISYLFYYSILILLPVFILIWLLFF